MSAADIQAFLDAHNAWRTKVNEPPLTWDAGLASLAQDWSSQMAQSGNFDHRPNNNEGENIFAGTGTYAPKDVVDAWGNENANFHVDTNTCDPNTMCGHYTQIVWASTTKVGCGSATGGDGTVYWTCNYDPPGNVSGIGPLDAAAQQQASQ
ncbi:MAG: SCP-like extracellular [Candidatus Dormibacteraeota bacterium]|uniref:SCP-like extracellular n=1 Tax=Candidatus Amunia macphersoniae TaxID=3127014 RepID=A0A934KKT5_9BACT|nr:SCP-like extracellular [Candidatus Dormibacteraeota bacterium]